jgi:phenylalanyl-tRNA synthetase beta chain
MRAPLSWIREFASIDAAPRDVAEALDQLGIEVEAVDEPGREIRGVIAARIIDVAAHPDADKLQLADVDYGDGRTRVVCGAANIEAGMVVPFAPAGATLPGGFMLERRKIRGVISDGMLCSPKELELSDDHEGILVLDPATAVGADVREVLGLDDVIFDVAITPNRPDAMSIVGIARELAAHFGVPLTVSESASKTGGATEAAISVVVDDAARCPRYLARVSTVAMGASPPWMARRLTLAGMRPISNVVDVTNYVLLERGQPLHAFDLDRLAGPGIVVRLARDGERITTLDGIERALSPDDLLICDADHIPQAIAGVMGGSTAEVSVATGSILLESAYFQPMGISRSSKRLGLRSESSARFERGVDPNGVGAAANRAMELLEQVAHADVLEGAVDVYPSPVQPQQITVRTERVNALLGTALEDAAVVSALEPLGMEITATAGALNATVPTWRPDLEREIDLVEEVARRVGLNEIPRTLPSTTGQTGGLTVRQRERRRVADTLVGMGCAEAVTLPLLAPADLEHFDLALDDAVEAANPLRAEESILRPMILPGLVAAVARNAGYGIDDVMLFELGQVFRTPLGDDPLPVEREHVAATLAGQLRRAPIEPDRPVDVYDAIDIMYAMGDALELPGLTLAPASTAGLHPARTAAVLVDGVEAGHVGELAPGVLAAMELAGPVVALELDLGILLDGRRRDRAFRSPSKYPASTIDLAFVVADHVPAASVAATLRGAGGALLESVRCFDVFRSGSLGAGRVSLAFALHFRAGDRTLTDEEVGGLRQACIDAVVSTHGAELRG